MPGTATELELLGMAVSGQIESFDRQLKDGAGSLDALFDALADRIIASDEAAPIRIVGFSIGAYIALEVASRLNRRDVSLDLVSAAAPLGDVSSINQMAGAPFFRLAQKSPSAFAAAAMAQALVARLAPGLLVDALFRTSRGADIPLRSEAKFREGMKQILRLAFRDGGLQYRREINAYVRDWSPLVTRVAHPVTLWQGAEDNWTPPAMSQALASRLPDVKALHLLPGLSHFSTLAAFWKAVAHESFRTTALPLG